MSKYILPVLLCALLGTSLSASTDNSATIISDKKQRIYWQDSLIPKKETRQDWDDAAEYCEKLLLHGLENWRLPTFTELLSIVDYTRFEPAINPLFQNVTEGTYWSSTDFSANISRAWTIDFRTGKTYYSYKTTNHAVRCVADFPNKKDEK